MKLTAMELQAVQLDGFTLSHLHCANEADASATHATSPTSTSPPAPKPTSGFAYLRSSAHLAAVRSLPCCVCGATLAVPAHSHSPEHGKRGDALSSDEFTIPLCGKSHQEYDPSGYRLRSTAWFIQKVKETAVNLRAQNRLLPEVELLLIERGVL